MIQSRHALQAQLPTLLGLGFLGRQSIQGSELFVLELTRRYHMTGNVY